MQAWCFQNRQGCHGSTQVNLNKRIIFSVRKSLTKICNPSKEGGQRVSQMLQCLKILSYFSTHILKIQNRSRNNSYSHDEYKRRQITRNKNRRNKNRRNKMKGKTTHNKEKKLEDKQKKLNQKWCMTEVRNDKKE